MKLGTPVRIAGGHLIGAVEDLRVLTAEELLVRNTEHLMVHGTLPEKGPVLGQVAPFPAPRHVVFTHDPDQELIDATEKKMVHGATQTVRMEGVDQNGQPSAEDVVFTETRDAAGKRTWTGTLPLKTVGSLVFNTSMFEE